MGAEDPFGRYRPRHARLLETERNWVRRSWHYLENGLAVDKIDGVNGTVLGEHNLFRSKRPVDLTDHLVPYLRDSRLFQSSR